MNNLKPRVICLTPVCNEGWVLNTHLQAATQWADAVVVGDQMSTDDTRQIVQRYHPKAMLVDNRSSGYHEGERQRVVFEAARKLFPDSKKILLAIDADEVLSANWQSSPEWQAILALPPGASIYAYWANIMPGFEQWFELGSQIQIGVVDDGQLGYSDGQFHVPRLQRVRDKPSLVLNEIRLLHFQYVDALRSASKNRLYQMQEWDVNPTRPIRLFRRFNSTLKIDPSQIHAIETDWVEGFQQTRVDWRSVRADGIYRWDRTGVESILARGEQFYRRLDVWDVDWNRLANQHGIDLGAKEIRDPRSGFEKSVHQFLRRTQTHMDRPFVRALQWALRPLGW